MEAELGAEYEVWFTGWDPVWVSAWSRRHAAIMYASRMSREGRITPGGDVLVNVKSVAEEPPSSFCLYSEEFHVPDDLGEPRDEVIGFDVATSIECKLRAERLIRLCTNCVYVHQAEGQKPLCMHPLLTTISPVDGEREGVSARSARMPPSKPGNCGDKGLLWCPKPGELAGSCGDLGEAEGVQGPPGSCLGFTGAEK